MGTDPRGAITPETTRRALLVGGLSLALVGPRYGHAGAARPTVVVHRDPT